MKQFMQIAGKVQKNASAELKTRVFHPLAGLTQSLLLACEIAKMITDITAILSACVLCAQHFFLLHKE